MKNKTIEAYNYYKGLNPGTLILFHVDDKYVAVKDDAKIVLSNLPEITVLESHDDLDLASVSDKHYLEVMMKLGDAGYVCNTIDCRNGLNSLDIPDPSQFQRDQMEDYLGQFLHNWF